MGKYWNGKHFNYVKTGSKKVSDSTLRKFVLEHNRGGKSAPAYYANLFVVRSRKILKLVGMGIVKICRNLVNGVKVLSIRAFTAFANLVDKSIRFLDDV